MLMLKTLQTQDNQSVLSIDQIQVCQECGCFATAVPNSMKWECKEHPDTPPQLRHVTVNDPYQPAVFNKSTVRPLNDPRPPIWQRNYRQNASLVGKSAHELPPSEIVYLVACGPSLEINGHWLRHVNKKRSVIITLNDAVNWVPNADYLLCMDHAFNRTRGHKHVTALLAPTCPNDLVTKPWKDRFWMRSSAAGEPFETIHKQYPYLWMYDEGLNCTFTAYQLIAQVFKPRLLILVGVDCGFSPDRERIGKPLHWSDQEHYYAVPDGRGGVQLTNALYTRVIMFTAATLVWFPKHGCQVINASPGSALPRSAGVQSTQGIAEQRPLNACLG